jgi:hypothetical protein
MKRLVLSVYLIAIAAIFGYSQSLSLSNMHGAIEPNSTIIQAGTPDSVELITYLNVKNMGNLSMNVLCKKVELKMHDSTEITMCWAGNCYPSNVFVSPNAQLMAPGQTITDFVGHYTQIAYQHFSSGESVIRWVFYDRSNVNDSVSVTIKYTSFPMGVDDATATVLSKVYPNPANGSASFSYSIPGGSQGTMVVRDLLGSSVQTQLLPAASGKATLNTMNLRDGIYFCTLLVDGIATHTQKLIVKH